LPKMESGSKVVWYMCHGLTWIGGRDHILWSNLRGESSWRMGRKSLAQVVMAQCRGTCTDLGFMSAGVRILRTHSGLNESESERNPWVWDENLTVLERPKAFSSRFSFTRVTRASQVKRTAAQTSLQSSGDWRNWRNNSIVGFTLVGSDLVKYRALRTQLRLRAKKLYSCLEVAP
jgi:hypothetical protein